MQHKKYDKMLTFESDKNTFKMKSNELIGLQPLKINAILILIAATKWYFVFIIRWNLAFQMFTTFPEVGFNGLRPIEN